MFSAQEEHPAVTCLPLSTGFGVKHLLCRAADTMRKVLNSLVDLVDATIEQQQQKNLSVKEETGIFARFDHSFRIAGFRS